MLAGLLAAGCSQGPAGPQRPSVESCAEFGISAIEHRVTVTSRPAACRGLTQAQVNLAVGQALYAMTGNVHGKARRRARARELSPLLGRLVGTVPAQRGPPPVAAPAGAGPPQARHPPALIVAAHGVFAVATILFALLAAIGAR
jgi:hypothetical protein